MKRILKIISLTFGGIIGLLIVFLMLIISGVLNPWIVQKISANAGNFIEGELTISKLEGNILSHFAFENIEIIQENEKLIQIEKAIIDYRILPLLQKEIIIDTLKLSGLQSFLIEDENKIWNVESLLKKTEENAIDTISSDFNWEIYLNHIQLNSIEAFINSNNSSTIPQQALLNTIFSFSVNADETVVNLSELNLTTKNPDFTVNKMAFNVQLKGQNINWQNLLIELPNSVMKSEGAVSLDSIINSQISFEATPFNFEDVKAWIPDLYGNPEIKIDLQKKDGQNYIDAQIGVPSQKLNINGTVSGTDDIPVYSLDIKADSLNGEYWLRKPEFNSVIIGEMNISGQGIDYEQSDLSVITNFTNIIYDGYDFSGVKLDLNKEKGDISGNIKAGTFFGKVNSQFKIGELFGIPNYNIKAKVDHLNLSKLTGDIRLKSDLNLEINAKGEGIDIATLTTDVQITSSNSFIFDQSVTDFNTQINSEKGNYNLKRFKVETPYLLFSINGKGNITDKNNLNFNLDIKDLEEISALFSEEEIEMTASLKGNITGPSHNLYLNSDMNLSYLLYDSIRIENAVAKIESRFTGNELTWKNISSDLKSYQQNLNREKLYFKADAQIGKANYGNYSLSEFLLNVEKIDETLAGTVTTNMFQGNINADFNVNHIFSIPEYTVQTDLSHLNISGFGGNEKIWSDLNLEINLTGNGNSAETINAELNLKSTGSTLQGLPVSDFNTFANYKSGEYSFQDFILETPLASLKADAKGDINGNNNITFSLFANDIKSHANKFNLDDIDFEGGIEGSLSGKTDSMQLQAQLKLENFKYDTIRVKNMQGETKIWLIDSLYSGNINFLSEKINIQELEVREIKFESDFKNGTANSDFSFFVSDSLQGNIRTILMQEQNPIIYFPEIDLNINNSRWENNSNTSFINLGPDSILINQLTLQSDDSFIKVNGIFSFHGNEDLQLEIENFNTINIPGLQLLPFKFSGIINTNAKLSGTAQFPVFNGTLDVTSPSIDSLKFSKFYTSLKYAEKKLELNSYVDDNTKRLILANAEIPLDFSFSGDINSLVRSTPINAHLQLNELDINQFEQFIPVKETELNGILSLDIALSNTIDSLLADGKFQLKNGSVNYPRYGINYQNIILNSHFNNSEFNLDSLKIHAGTGNLKLNGKADLSSFTQLPDNFNFHMEGNNFRAFNSELIKAFVNTRLDISGTPDNPVFGGNMTINRSTLNTDIFLREYNRVYDTSEEPLLVQAQKNLTNLVQVQIVNIDSLKKPPPDIYKNLKGEFDIKIPGNTWVKGKNMNFEISGDLKVLKEREQIDLFGNMMVKRGFYKIYGKRLDFEEGEITFTGGQSINPNVNFIIGYKFRDPDKTLRKLNINIKGQVSQPEITFSLDDSEIEEKDAISYLIFNKSLAQLDTKENSTVSGSNLDIAKDLALIQVTNLVKDALQSSIGLDVIEFSGIKGGTEGSVSIGKYITNNLYLNYERNFALDKKNKQIEPEKISLEYQIMRSLFLQATNQKTNSGFDFIFKWTWK